MGNKENERKNRISYIFYESHSQSSANTDTFVLDTHFSRFNKKNLSFFRSHFAEESVAFTCVVTTTKIFMLSCQLIACT